VTFPNQGKPPEWNQELSHEDHRTVTAMDHVPWRDFLLGWLEARHWPHLDGQRVLAVLEGG
jgi:hypothetical protein